MITDSLISFASSFPPIVATFILGASPILEIRGAIPISLTVYNMPWFISFFAAGLGNIIPIFPLYAFLHLLRDIFFSFHKSLGGLYDRFTKRAHRKMREKYDAYGLFALFLFTAIPFPLTGVYTATVGAILLDIPIKKSLPILSLGVIVSGLLTLLLIRIGVTFL